MYLRLAFTSAQPPVVMMDFVWYLINNPSITTVSELSSSGATSHIGTAYSSFLNTTYSQIIRSASTANIQAYRTYYTAGYNTNVTFTLRFKAYDTTQRYYYQLSSPSTGQYTLAVGDTYSIAWPSTNSVTTASAPPAISNTITQWSASTQSYSDYFVQISDKGFMWAAQGQTTGTVTGFPTTYSSVTNYVGPFLCGQYTRYDLFNTEANGMIPLLCTRGFVTTSNPVYGMSGRHFTTLNNPLAANAEVGVQVIHAMNMTNTSSVTPISKSIAQNVHLGVGCRTTDASGALTTASSVTTAGSAVYGKAVTTTANERYPTPDNTGYGFALLPITWSLSSYMMAGGNMSDQTGVYIFNGDYVAGDEFVYNSKTYVIWPLYDGVSNRIGIAVPKE